MLAVVLLVICALFLGRTNSTKTSLLCHCMRGLEQETDCWVCAAVDHGQRWIAYNTVGRLMRAGKQCNNAGQSWQVWLHTFLKAYSRQAWQQMDAVQ